MALLTAVFSLGFQTPPIGDSFAVFYATGLVPFLIYSEVSGKLSQAINFSRPLLAYPRVTLVDAIIARAILNALSSLLVAGIVLSGLVWLLAPRTSVDIWPILMALAMAVLIGFGVGVLNCYLVTRFPVWQRLWSIVNRPMFILSCVVFTFETVPLPYQDWLWYNPIVHVVGALRSGLYFGYSGAYVNETYVVLVCLLCTAVGFFLIWRDRDKLLNV